MKGIEVNPGFKIEKEMKKWFKGKSHDLDCVDFQTSSSLYEVKSCKLLLNCSNKRNKKNKKIITTQLGRFFVNIRNHRLLKKVSKKENKIPKYLFAIVVGKQKIWKVMEWEKVDEILNMRLGKSPIRIHKIFHKELELK